MEIHLIFTQNNKLKVSIFNNQFQHGDFKICFSLVYSIQAVKGGSIVKKVGRYYEINSTQDEIFFSLQEPRIGSYNLSCGPEGLFVLDKNDTKIECKVNPLKFETPIPKIKYSEDNDTTFNPIIPLPNTSKLKNEMINFKDLIFKIPSSEKVFFDNLENLLKVSDIKFNTLNGYPIVFTKKQLQPEEYQITIEKNLITIHYSDYGGKFYSIISLIQLLNYYKSSLPLGLIQDSPTLNWRGMHLDCARQFYTINEIKRPVSYTHLTLPTILLV